MLVAALWSWFHNQGGGDVSGRPRIVDGDSLFVSGREVRLVGIDAPEGRQTCQRDGQNWRCGDASRDTLARLAGNHIVCRGQESDQHGRLLAVCEADGGDLNGRMVAEGMAVAYGRYQSLEAEARSNRRGLWASRFEQPRDWRREHMRGQQ